MIRTGDIPSETGIMTVMTMSMFSNEIQIVYELLFYPKYYH